MPGSLAPNQQGETSTVPTQNIQDTSNSLSASGSGVSRQGLHTSPHPANPANQANPAHLREQGDLGVQGVLNLKENISNPGSNPKEADRSEGSVSLTKDPQAGPKGGSAAAKILDTKGPTTSGSEVANQAESDTSWLFDIADDIFK